VKPKVIRLGKVTRGPDRVLAIIKKVKAEVRRELQELRARDAAELRHRRKR